MPSIVRPRSVPTGRVRSLTLAELQAWDFARMSGDWLGVANALDALRELASRRRRGPS